MTVQTDNESSVTKTLRSNQTNDGDHTTAIRYTRRRKTKQRLNTICVGHHYAQANTNNVNKTWTLLQETGGKDI